MKQLSTLILTVAASALVSFGQPTLQSVGGETSTASANSYSVESRAKTELLFKQHRQKSQKTAIQAPTRAAEDASLPTLQGWSMFSDLIGMDMAEHGLYKLPGKDGYSTFIFGGSKATYGAMNINGVMYCTTAMSTSLPFTGYIKAYDIENQRLAGEFTVSDPKAFPLGGVVDPTDGSVYAVTYAHIDDETNRQQLSKLTITPTGITAETIGEFSCDLPGNRLDFASIAIDNTGQIYCIGVGFQNGSVAGTMLYKVDKTTAALTAVGPTGEDPTFPGSACIDPVTNRMYWNVNPEDFTAWLCEVDLNTGAATRLYQLTDGLQVAGLYVAESLAQPGAPGECSEPSAVFNQSASLTGKITVTAPTKLFDGSEASGKVKIVVLCDGEEVASKDEVAYGETVTIDVTVSSVGSKHFSIYAVNSVGAGPKVFIEDVWCGPDYPVAPSPSLTYADGKMQLSWPAVTASSHNGYLDPAAVTYTVTRADGTIVAEGISATSFSEEMAEPESPTIYYYNVVAMNGEELVSATGRSNSVTLGFIEPPYTAEFTEEGLATWTVLDENKDGRTWYITDGAVRIPYNGRLAMDDWMISTPLKLKAGMAYLVTVKTYCGSSSYPERLEVKYGKGSTADAMTETLFAATDVDSEDAMTLSDYLVPETDGIYFIGIHGISDADTYGLYVNGFSIAAGASASVPAPASDLSLVADNEGLLKATVSFTAPTKTLGGKELTDLTKIEVYREGNTLVKTFENPEVGANLSFVDEVPAAGDYTYTVIGHNAEGKGLSAEVSGHIGFSAPVAVATATLKRTSTEGEVTVTWDAVTKDVNDLTLPAVKYTVSRIVDGELVQLATDLTETAYTMTIDNPAVQEMVQLAVVAYNEYGSSEALATEIIPSGRAVAGVRESFANAAFETLWSVAGNARIVLCSDADFDGEIVSNDSDNGFVAFSARNSHDTGELQSVLIAMPGVDKAKMKFTVYNVAGYLGKGPDNNLVVVRARTADDYTWQDVSSVAVNEYTGDVAGWAEVEIDLSAYANKTVQLSLGFDVINIQYIMFDNIRIGDYESGIDGIAIDADGADATNTPAAYYNLNGIRVSSDNLPAGVYVRVQGTKATKVIVK